MGVQQKLTLVLIALTLLGGGGFVLYQRSGQEAQQEERNAETPLKKTADWQTYSNKGLEKEIQYYGFGFEFEYPNEYKISEHFDWVEITSQDESIRFSILRSSPDKPWLDAPVLLDFSLPFNSELLSLSDYLNKFYRLYFYENQGSGAYRVQRYKNVMESDYFESIVSKDKSTEIQRAELNENLDGFESRAYLMHNDNRTVIMVFSWSIRGKDEALAKEALAQFDSVLSTFRFVD